MGTAYTLGAWLWIIIIPDFIIIIGSGGDWKESMGGGRLIRRECGEGARWRS